MSSHNNPTGIFQDLPRGHFSGGANLAGEGDNELRKVIVNQRARQRGVIPSARMAASVNPTNGDIICTIGGKQFKCVTSLAAADTFVQVKREASAALTYANLVDAINGTTSTKDSKWVEATTAFDKRVLADLVTATVLRLRGAVRRGGVVSAQVAESTTLAAAVSGGASSWSVDNLNATGKALEDQDIAIFDVTVTQRMLTAGVIYIELPFTIGGETHKVHGAANDTIDTNDLVSWSGSTLTLTVAVGGYNPLSGLAVGSRIAFVVWS